MNFEVMQVLEQSNDEAKPRFQLRNLNPRLQTELNRFKEIQKNPQLLLQILCKMENEKQVQMEDPSLSIDTNKHKTVDDKVICYICGRLLRRRSMYVHLKAHTGCSSYPCPIDQCNSVYKSKQGLTYHQRVIHHLKRTSGTKKGRPCLISSADLVENGKKSYICKLCGKCYKTQRGLSEHLKIHTGERPERCRFCYRTFRQKSALGRHSKTCSHELSFPAFYSRTSDASMPITHAPR